MNVENVSVIFLVILIFLRERVAYKYKISFVMQPLQKEYSQGVLADNGQKRGLLHLFLFIRSLMQLYSKQAPSRQLNPSAFRLLEGNTWLTVKNLLFLLVWRWVDIPLQNFY